MPITTSPFFQHQPETPRSAYNMASYLRLGESFSFSLPTFASMQSFRNSLHNICLRQNTREDFSIVSNKRNFSITITRLTDAPLRSSTSTSTTVNTCNSLPSSEDLPPVPDDYLSSFYGPEGERIHVLKVAIEAYNSGKLSDDAYRETLMLYTEEEIKNASATASAVE